MSGNGSAAPIIPAMPLQGDTDLVGKDLSVEVGEGDTLVDLAQRFGLGRLELQWANPTIDVWQPVPGQALTLPLRWILPQAPRTGLVINLPELRLYQFTQRPGGRLGVVSYPVSIGRLDWQTPLGRLKVVERLKNPDWRPTESVRKESLSRGKLLPPLMLAGPQNPLGDYALRLSKTRYLIHGTNKPAGIGMRVSHGCIRLYPADIEMLFHDVAVDSTVNIINQPIKVGLLDGKFYVEVHPPLDEFNVGDAQLTRQALQMLHARVEKIKASSKDSDLSLRVSQSSLLRAIREKNGRPILVALLTDNQSR